MEYKYSEQEGIFEEFKAQDGGTWEYIPLKSFLKEGNDKECIIFGDVTGTAADTALRYVSMSQSGVKKTLRIYRYQNRLPFFDKILGYIAVYNPNGKYGYVRIRKKSIKKMIAVILLFILLMIGAVTALLLNQKSDPGLDDQAIAYQLPGGVKNTDPNSILLPGYDVLEMNYETQKVDAALLNPEGNDCYFKFHILLKKDGTELYQTGLIKPGTAITSFKTEKKLDKGDYPILINVDAADLKNPDNLYNGGAIEAVLKVK